MKQSGEGYQQLGPTKILPGPFPLGITLRFEVLGDQLKLYVNNVVQIVTHDSTITTPGLVGMRGLNSRHDEFSAKAAPSLLATVPFTDDFNTPTNRPDLDRTWTEQVGAFTTQGNNAAAAVPGVNIATLNTPSALTDVDLQASITLGGFGTHAGLVARYSGPAEDNFYVGLVFNNNGVYEAYLFLRQNGVFTQLARNTTPLAFIGTGTLRLQVSGTTLNLFVNGVLKASANDSALSTGLVGMRALGSSLDDFSAN